MYHGTKMVRTNIIITLSQKRLEIQALRYSGGATGTLLPYHGMVVVPWYHGTRTYSWHSMAYTHHGTRTYSWHSMAYTYVHVYHGTYTSCTTYVYMAPHMALNFQYGNTIYSTRVQNHGGLK